MPDSLEQRLSTISKEVGHLPDPEEPPETTLGILNRSRLEQDWQRLLVYFLNPDAPHGLDHSFLEHFLSVLSDRSDFEYRFSRLDLPDVQVATEVRTPEGRPDVFLWADEEWFICLELKVHASEGDDQARRYVDPEKIEGLDLDPSNVSSEDQHYAFLAPADGATPSADAFVKVPWEELVPEFQDFLAQSQGTYPARTTAQLEDFIDTIRSELDMTEYQESQQEKVSLYLEHHETIWELQDAYDTQVETFQNIWGSDLESHLDASTNEERNPPGEYAHVNLDLDDGSTQEWVFRQGNSDWSWMYRWGWWTHLEDDRLLYQADKPNARVGFIHRFKEKYWKDAIRNRELKFWLRNAPSGQDEFKDNFAERFNNDPKIPNLIPNRTKVTGNKSNLLEATYPIEVDSHQDFFDAYVAALANAIDDHVISNPELIQRITELYDKTVEEDAVRQPETL